MHDTIYHPRKVIVVTPTFCWLIYSRMVLITSQNVAVDDFNWQLQCLFCDDTILRATGSTASSRLLSAFDELQAFFLIHLKLILTWNQTKCVHFTRTQRSNFPTPSMRSMETEQIQKKTCCYTVCFVWCLLCATELSCYDVMLCVIGSQVSLVEEMFITMRLPE